MCIRDSLMTDGQTDGRPMVALRLHSNTKYSDGHVTCHPLVSHVEHVPSTLLRLQKKRDRRPDRRTADTRQTRRHLLNSTRAKYFQYYLVTYFCCLRVDRQTDTQTYSSQYFATASASAGELKVTETTKSDNNCCCLQHL